MMIKIEDERYVGGTPYASVLEVSGIMGALHGMRNPKNSWRLADSYINENGETVIGENDMRLAQTLIKAGPEHRKFLRMIHVQFDINLPRYVWSELDTYGYVVRNSCSTMHKLLNNDDEKDWKETILDELLYTRGDIQLENFWVATEDVDIVLDCIGRLNSIKREYFATTKTSERKHLRRRAKQILNESWLQMRTLDTNYEQLRNIYLQRRHHLLDVEWPLVCKMIKSLPYAKELILYGV